MKNSARLSMLQLAGLMMKNPDTIFIVEGHTDSFGSEEYNAVLSLMRANAVRQWLLDNGISLTRPNGECRLYIRACGASRPVVSTKGTRMRRPPTGAWKSTCASRERRFLPAVFPSLMPWT